MKTQFSRKPQVLTVKLTDVNSAQDAGFVMPLDGLIKEVHYRIRGAITSGITRLNVLVNDTVVTDSIADIDNTAADKSVIGRHIALGDTKFFDKDVLSVASDGAGTGTMDVECTVLWFTIGFNNGS